MILLDLCMYCGFKNMFFSPYVFTLLKGNTDPFKFNPALFHSIYVGLNVLNKINQTSKAIKFLSKNWEVTINALPLHLKNKNKIPDYIL